MDLLPVNVQKPWHDLPIAVKKILGHPYIDLEDCWVCFNMQKISDILFPKKIPAVILTAHTEYLDHARLGPFFQQHKNTLFLLLTDWEHDANSQPWPTNVTTVSWLTWHHQLSHIIEYFGINNAVNAPCRRISSLSHRHEFHKAAVTAYLIKNFSTEDMILSWWNAPSPHPMAYLDPEYKMPNSIAQYLLDRDFQTLDPIRPDQLGYSPLYQGDWTHPAYAECLFNCTNESVFNDFTVEDSVLYRVAGPYLTEKTWKPLLAGRPFLPVGQKGSLCKLSRLGLHFVPQLMDIDCVEAEHLRILKIWDTIDWIASNSLDDLFELTRASATHNLLWISDGQFAKACDQHNLASQSQIENWYHAL